MVLKQIRKVLVCPERMYSRGLKQKDRHKINELNHVHMENGRPQATEDLFCKMR